MNADATGVSTQLTVMSLGYDDGWIDVELAAFPRTLGVAEVTVTMRVSARLIQSYPIGAKVGILIFPEAEPDTSRTPGAARTPGAGGRGDAGWVKGDMQ